MGRFLLYCFLIVIPARDEVANPDLEIPSSKLRIAPE
jgi:hypothetical protein